ncbi:hypothetical protein DL96DRAFT_1608007 [Flagelloscypha sp. PMI_526]|nr:hypothetical protein DL96DRAFT_1608007 [Flagelloscypha sp. PMI_526]
MLFFARMVKCSATFANAPRRLRMSSLSGGQTSLYHSKVHAFPFACTPERAKEILNVNHHFPKLSQAVSFSNNFTRDRMAMVYYPLWVIAANASLRLGENASEDLILPTDTITCDFGIFPADFSPNLESKLVQWDESLLQQFSDKHPGGILTLPYDLSPFPSDKLQSIHLENSSISMDAVKFNFYTALPVLIPVYVRELEFEAEGKSVSLNLWLDASSSLSNKWLDQPKCWGIWSSDETDLELDPHGYPEIENRDLTVNPLDTAPRTGSALGKSLTYSLQENHTVPELIAMLWRSPTNGPPDMEDVRVRPATNHEISQSRQYVDALRDLTMIDMVDSLESLSATMHIPNPVKKLVPQVLESIYGRIHAHKPEWWAEYEKNKQRRG